jgi:hypothetical protein
MSYARVAQDLLNNLRVLALFEHEGGESVPEIVGASGFRQAAGRVDNLLDRQQVVRRLHEGVSLISATLPSCARASLWLGESSLDI